MCLLTVKILQHVTTHSSFALLPRLTDLFYAMFMQRPFGLLSFRLSERTQFFSYVQPSKGQAKRRRERAYYLSAFAPKNIEIIWAGLVLRLAVWFLARGLLFGISWKTQRYSDSSRAGMVKSNKNRSNACRYEQEIKKKPDARLELATLRFQRIFFKSHTLYRLSQPGLIVRSNRYDRKLSALDML